MVVHTEAFRPGLPIVLTAYRVGESLSFLRSGGRAWAFAREKSDAPPQDRRIFGTRRMFYGRTRPQGEKMGGRER